MKQYKEVFYNIVENGTLKPNRTGVDTLSITGALFEHNMSDGFPLLTTKRVAHKAVFAELEFFIKGVTDKRWLQERGVHIWDEWCDPSLVPYGHSPEILAAMRNERSLGPIYGSQWRNFNGVDQLKLAIARLKSTPEARDIIVSAWNPLDLHRMALPPCHYSFQVITRGVYVDLVWNQRSCDFALGLPFNIASYGMLLVLFSMELDLKPGKLVGTFGDMHIYTNHIDGLREQMRRETRKLPEAVVHDRGNLLDFKYTDVSITGYDPHPAIKYEIAV